MAFNDPYAGYVAQRGRLRMPVVAANAAPARMAGGLRTAANRCRSWPYGGQSLRASFGLTMSPAWSLTTAQSRS